MDFMFLDSNASNKDANAVIFPQIHALPLVWWTMSLQFDIFFCVSVLKYIYSTLCLMAPYCKIKLVKICGTEMAAKHIWLGRELWLMCSESLCKPIDLPVEYGCRSSVIISATFQFTDRMSRWLILTFGFWGAKSLYKLTACISTYCCAVMMQNRRHSSLFFFQQKLCYAAVQHSSVLSAFIQATHHIAIVLSFS